MPTRTVRQPRSQLGRLGRAVVLLATCSLMCIRQPTPPTRTDADTPRANDSPTRAPQAQAAQQENPQTRPADAACLSCHENLKDELIVRVHEKRSKLCTNCHGSSTAHVAGGSPQPRPDHVFAREDVEGLCTKCHRRHRPAMIERAVRRREGSKSPKGRPVTTDSVCTDCHGAHVLAD